VHIVPPLVVGGGCYTIARLVAIHTGLGELEVSPLGNTHSRNADHMGVSCTFPTHSHPESEIQIRR
jgi:hypothetical protein